MKAFVETVQSTSYKHLMTSVQFAQMDQSVIYYVKEEKKIAAKT